MENTVTCLICGHVAITLARHLKAVHGIFAAEYLVQHPGARIRSEVCEANRRAAIAKSHVEKPRAGMKKSVICPCGVVHEIGLTADVTKSSRCPDCVKRDEEAYWEAHWASKVEKQGYVICTYCGHKAENLTSHIQNVHPESIGNYPDQMVALCSAVRDKTYLKGKKLSDETRALMSANAGRWNNGHTKETHPSVAAISEHRMGQSSWNKGLTKEDHPSLRIMGEKSALWCGEKRYWSNGLKANFTLEDFKPFLDEYGAVDRFSMSEVTGYDEQTITKYMEELGLSLSKKYVKARVERMIQNGTFQAMAEKNAENVRIRLTREQFEPYMTRHGKVRVDQAIAGLGHNYTIITRECDRLGLPRYNVHSIRQRLCLDTISLILDGAVYEKERTFKHIRNPKSGYLFRYDGYFPEYELAVEFHGFQHYVFPSYFIKDEQAFFDYQERDRIKENTIHADPVLRYFVVREDEPYTDVEYIRRRLIDAGILTDL